MRKPTKPRADRWTIMAAHCGWDRAEMKGMHYQPTRHFPAVAALDDAYYCATPPGRRPPKTLDDLPWRQVESPWAAHYGWIMWEAAIPRDGDAAFERLRSEILS